MSLLRLLLSFWPISIILSWLIPSNSDFPKWGWFRQRAGRSFLIWVCFAAVRLFLFFNKILPLEIFEPVNSILFYSLGVILILFWFSEPLLRNWRRQRLLHTSRKVEDLQILPARQFEMLIAAYFEHYGHHAEVIGNTGDHGIDLLVHANSGEKWIVQCKRWRGVIGESILRDLYGSMHHENAQRAFLMTTGTFSLPALSWAREKPITLYDGNGLVRLLSRIKRY